MSAATEPSIKDCRCGERGGVVDSRPGPNGWRRRYRCLACGWQWSTLEVRATRGHRLTTTEVERANRRQIAFEVNEAVQTAIADWAAK